MRPLSFTVATYNLYLGADLAPMFTGVDADRLGTQVADIWAAVEGSHPAERMAAAATVLAGRVPDVVAVQEAALWRSGETGFTRRHDLLGALLDSLAAAGTPYRVAVQVEVNMSQDFSARLAASTGQVVELIDRSAILVREDPAIEVLSTRADTFSARLEVDVLGETMPLRRAWCAAMITIDDAPVTVFATHLEAYDQEIRSQQAHQLLTQLAPSPDGGTPVPVVLLGDMNSPPAAAGSPPAAAGSPPAAAGSAPSPADRQPPQPIGHEPGQDRAASHGPDAYEHLTASGLRDAWLMVRPEEPGYTFGQDPLLRNARPSLTERLDLVLVDDSLRVIGAEVLGAQTEDRTVNGLWPSDHGCLMVELELDREA